MRPGLCVANIGTYADPRVAARLAAAAEGAGWEAFFVWDHLGFVWDGDTGDPWLILGAVAASTSRMLVGTAVTPVPRRRLQVLASQVATLDRLSDGRAVFGAGLGGVKREFAAFGDPDDDRVRAAMLDEGLGVLDRLWSGDEVTHHGEHYVVEGIRLAPAPARGRIPIWIGGGSAPALRRAARWDGWFADSDDSRGMKLTADALARSAAALSGIEIVVTGYSAAGDVELRGSYERAGATWWLESVHDRRGSFDELLARVAAGP
jgi:alkanesulfonate monooxygenase SsuD/methylene tetrahydromethanopterin reductase-like flavin-dependent oxidoreductase (luciferase family)